MSLSHKNFLVRNYYQSSSSKKAFDKIFNKINEECDNNNNTYHVLSKKFNFGFKINVGHPPDKTRPQLRIKHGSKIGGTNRYVITSSKCPFPSKTAYDDTPVSDESIPENGLESYDEYRSSNVPTDEVLDESYAELEKSFSGIAAPFPKETAS